MLQSIKRWFTGAAGTGWAAAEQWAASRNYGFRRSRDNDGFIIDAGTPVTGWRLEWGPSQRSYISGGELRLRADIGEADLQLLVLSRALMDAMEKAVFEQFTEELQTRIDTATPEEMRWLVLLPKLPAAELKGLREDFGAAGSNVKWLGAWLDGPLAAALQQARATWLAVEDPFVLILNRGRLVLRTGLPEPDAGRLGAALALFEVAAREARRIAVMCAHDSGVASTQPALWTGSADDDAPTTR